MTITIGADNVTCTYDTCDLYDFSDVAEDGKVG